MGLDASEVADVAPPPAVEELAAKVEDDGGAVIASYREPFGGNWVLLVSLPIDLVEATPFQRELSEAHAERLANVIPKVGRFLDPVIALRHDGGYWTPNGLHRLTAMRNLGAKAILALLLPERDVAFRILALNTEKAHNLKDRSLEVIRMMRALAADPETAKRPESDWAFEFEEPAFATLGLCYEKRPRFSGSLYLPVLKRIESFTDHAVAMALAERQHQADALLILDEAVSAAVERLHAAGMRGAYLKSFVAAQINPLRLQGRKPGQAAPKADFEETIERMIAAADRLDPSRVRPEQLAAMGGAAAEE